MASVAISYTILEHFVCGLWKADSAALAIFLLHLELLTPPLETGNIFEKLGKG
jgi:hypothetical protein